MIYNQENMEKLEKIMNKAMYNIPKVLIIGQAPAAVKQEVPYDTTMLYDWLKEIGVEKEQAQRMFEFEAVYDKFPGRDEKGRHLAPTQEQMNEHWPTLSAKILYTQKVIILGGVAKDFIQSKGFFIRSNDKALFLMHPSKMNFNRYNRNKQAILIPLKEFLKQEIEYFKSPLRPWNYNSDNVYPEGSIKD